MRDSNRLKLLLVRIAKILIFIGICVSVNMLITHFLGPSTHKGKEMWSYYYSQENADTIIVGTSVTEMIDEFVVDEYTGRTCINMGTPSQYFATSRSIIETAASERPVDTIILMMGFDALERDEDLSATLSVEDGFYINKSNLHRLAGFIKNNIEYSLDGRNIKNSESINKWMSWPVSCTVYFDQIKSNWEKKQYYKNAIPDIDTEGLNVVTYDRIPMSKRVNIGSDVENEIQNIKALTISRDSVIMLKQMCEYCTSNGITFIVMISPHKSGYADSFGGEYDKLNSLVAGVVQGAGCTYLNLNDLPSVTDLMTDEYYTDSEHVTHEGIEVASGIMSDILNLLTGKRN